MMNQMSTPPNTYGAKWMNIPVEYHNISAVVVHRQQVEQVAERKKQSHHQAGKQAKQEQGPEVVPALLGLYTDVLHP